MNNNKFPAVCTDEGQTGLVSVIIPTYNRGYIIKPTIESVLAQTYRNFEIIVVDDGSTDDTRAVIDRFGAQVRYIYQPNAGLAAARNTGLAAARGEFIAFQDSDDIWLPWKLEAQIAVMRHIPQLSIVWTDMTAVTPQGEIVRTHHLRTMYSVYRKLDVETHLSRIERLGDLLPHIAAELRDVRIRSGDMFSAMALGNLVHPPVALIRRTLLRKTGGLDMAFSGSCEDYEFFWRLSRSGPGALIEAPGMLYRVDAVDQLTSPKHALRIARGNLLALQRHLKKHHTGIQLPRKLLRRHLADSLLWVGREELFAPDGRRTNAIRHLCHSLWFNPWQKQPFMLLLVCLSTPRALFGMFRSMKRVFVGAT